MSMMSAPSEISFSGLSQRRLEVSEFTAVGKTVGRDIEYRHHQWLGEFNSVGTFSKFAMSSLKQFVQFCVKIEFCPVDPRYAVSFAKYLFNIYDSRCVEPKASQKEGDVLVTVGDPSTVDIYKARDIAVGDDHIRQAHIAMGEDEIFVLGPFGEKFLVDLGGSFDKRSLSKSLSSTKPFLIFF